MKRHQWIWVVILSVLVSLPAFSQPEDPSLLSLERIFSSNEFRQERFGPARWLEDGSGYTTLEPSKTESGGRDIIKYHPGSGKRKVLIPASRLIPSGKDQPLYIANYTWSPDGKRLLIFTNTRRVWRQNTRGDYWILDLKTWSLEQLGMEFEQSRLMFAKFSPEAKRVAYVYKNNIYVENIRDHVITQITHDGSVTIINGTFDWVYEEEFGLRDGFRWSPDGKWIAYWQLDAEGIRDFYMINNTDSLYPFLIPVQYPKVGTINSACRVGTVPSNGGNTKWLNVPGDSRNNYIARMDWAANSKELVLQHLNRLQNTNEVMLGDIQTGKVYTVFVDKDSAWVDVGNDLKWMENGKKFTFVSEQDGWNHAYLISRSGKKVTCITPGNFDVIRIVQIDDRNGWLYYMASPDNPTQLYLYRTKLNSKGKPQRLSPKNQGGTHRYQMSPDAKWAIHTYSSFEKTPIIELVRLPSHKTVRMLVDNSTLWDKIQTLKRSPVEFFRVNIGDGVELDAYQLKPYNFDPNKKYPVLFHVYGEPAGQTVLDRWRGSGYLWHLLLTQKGYIVISVDNRGTPAPRGRRWRKIIYGQIGILASADQAAAVQKISQWDYVDEQRIGVWGWSGGGSMTLNAMFRYPDLYHTGMSVAPVPDQHLYDTIYQERYMSLPSINEENFVKGSPITYAKNLKGNLLVIHGTGDDNVHYQGTERLINELIKHNKYFTMMAYPNRSHGIYEGRNTTRHLYELLTRYLKENLPPGPVQH
ncbi:S9 family peptidase [bacterium]